MTSATIAGQHATGVRPTASTARGRGRHPTGPRHGLLVRVVSFLLSSLAALLHAFLAGSLARNRRFFLGAIICVALECAAAAIYYFLLPPTYISRWTFILPTSSSGVSLQLESIGHAQSVPSSPFGSSTLSPKVIYREIASSEIVRRAAAGSLGVELTELGQPRIKLIDETALMLFEMSGHTAAEAQARSLALISAFNEQLDKLRKDEVVRRALVVQDSLKIYQENLQAARNRILEQQGMTGVLSINQFNEAATSLELMRRKLTDQRSEVEKLSAEKQQLIERLGLTPALATAVIKLAANQSFAKLAIEYADASVLLRHEQSRLGARNPALINLQQRWQASEGEIAKLATGIGLEPTKDLGNLALLTSGSQHAELLRSLVASEIQIVGRKREIAALIVETRVLEKKIKGMSADVARLEDLKKDHLVAEAVFTSALARLDTNKTDIYASYPMVQTLAPPDSPEKPSSPRLAFAIIGALLASLLSIIAWGMAWLRHEFAHRR